MRDANSGENLIGSTVHSQAHMAGTTTNQFGFYSITLPEGEVELTYSYVGYTTQVVKINLINDITININLEDMMLINELEVVGTRVDAIQESTQMSRVSVPIAQIKSLPAFLGEVDVLKTLQLMPGIQSGGEGTSGLYVRGGGPDQNLILLDGVPVYNAAHLFGFFSVFNADAVNNIEVYKGGFPARYGGRISSVLDINLKEGNAQEFRGEGSIGLVATRLTLEGPIIKDKTSFIVSGRRTYIDVLAAPFIAMANKNMPPGHKANFGYYFYDLTAKINHRFSPRNRIYLSAYMGDDKFYAREEIKESDEYGNAYPGSDPNTFIYHHVTQDRNYKSDTGLQWGNITAAFRWNHIFTNKLFGNTTVTYSRYRFNVWGASDNRTTESHSIRYNTASVSDTTFVERTRDYFEMLYNSSIQDWSGRIAFDWMPSPKHYIRFGSSAIYHTFNPSAMAFNTVTTDTTTVRKLGDNQRYAWEYSIFAEDDLTINSRLKANIGFHWSAFAIESRFYHYPQPRVAMRYLINSELSVKAAYSRMAQYIHLLANSSVGLPTDLWVPTTHKLRPQVSDQVAIGLAQNFRNNYEITLEGYYKTMHNVIEYKEGANFFDFDTGSSWEDKIVQGFGRSYGMELFAQKKTGKFTGWFGYTLSWTDRQFDELNSGKRFFYKYDRRHDISIAAVYRFNDRIEGSATWVFGTGNSVTIPIGIYQVTHPMGDEYEEDRWSGWQYEYGERNGYKMASYHRLDLSIAFIKQKRWGERRWIIGVYNAYNRKNPFYVDVEERSRNVGTVEHKQFKYVQYSLFPIIPSVAYNFKF
jgi:hypothetical protein